jgi:hypothetical protein
MIFGLALAILNRPGSRLGNHSKFYLRERKETTDLEHGH